MVEYLRCCRAPYRMAFIGVMLALLCTASVSAQEEEARSQQPYRLQPGDQVTISVVPQSDYDCSGTVLPDGKLYLKNIGEVDAAGLTLPQLSEHVRKVLEEELVDPRVTVTVSKTSTLPKVTVIGAVGRPGPIDLEPELRVRKAIELAGGPTREADLHGVIIIHKDLTRAIVDLATPERVVDPTQNRLLEDGDSVEIPLIPRQVTVVGAVGKPGPVDLEEGLRLRKAVELAGGALKDADLSRVILTRKDLTQSIVDLSTPERVADPEHNQLLQDGDSVEIPLQYKTGFVSITGAVVNPGSYELKPGMALEDLILAAGKLLPLADTEHMQFRQGNTPVQTIDLVARQNLGLNGKILLQPGDEVFIPTHTQKVLVVGAVQNPGLHALKPGQTLFDFFTEPSKTTGMQGEENAGPAAALDGSRVDLRRVQLIRRGEQAVGINLSEVLKKPSSKQNMVLRSGDVIFLPPKEMRQKRDLLNYVGMFTPLYYLMSIF